LNHGSAARPNWSLRTRKGTHYAHVDFVLTQLGHRAWPDSSRPALMGVSQNLSGPCTLRLIRSVGVHIRR
jgi:hypothetical protein